MPYKRGEGITKVTKFKTDDGVEHDTFQQAQKHKSKTAFESWCRLYLNKDSAPEEIAEIIQKCWQVTKRKEQ